MRFSITSHVISIWPSSLVPYVNNRKFNILDLIKANINRQLWLDWDKLKDGRWSHSWKFHIITAKEYNIILNHSLVYLLATSIPHLCSQGIWYYNIKMMHNDMHNLREHSTHLAIIKTSQEQLTSIKQVTLVICMEP